jgi:uncharacterized protein (TIGR02186 family)
MTGWLAMQRTLAPALIGLAMLVAGPVMAAPKQIVADLSNSRVDITSSYHGTELLLFGAYEGMPGDDIILVVQGPATDIIQRRKAKRAGIWVNVETKIWQQAPSFYHVFATDDLSSITDEQGLGNASSGAAIAGNPEQQDNLRRNMQANGLWQVLPSSIFTQQDMLFRASLSLPSNIPPGEYSVRVLHFRDGVALSERATDMNVRKAGLSALIYRFAHDYSALYGIFAIIFAVASGWLAAAAFRRK